MPKEFPAATEPTYEGRAKDTHALRAVKIVKPECHVATQMMGKTEYTTGPCQVAAATDRAKQYNWWKKCTHGPQYDQEGKAIKEDLRPYYEGGIVVERKPVINQDGVIESWEETPTWKVHLRLTQVVVDPVAMSGQGLQYQLSRGAKLAKEFGYDNFCEFYNCWRRDTQKFKNGTFCSEFHAKLVKANETGVILPMGGFDSAWPRAVSSEKRREVLAGIEV
jgi:hypothetical protein